MTDNTCVRCGAVTPPHDIVSVASPDGAFRLLCSRCLTLPGKNVSVTESV